MGWLTNQAKVHCLQDPSRAPIILEATMEPWVKSIELTSGVLPVGAPPAGNAGARCWMLGFGFGANSYSTASRVSEARERQR
jgi:hypothetical protein